MTSIVSVLFVDTEGSVISDVISSLSSSSGYSFSHATSKKDITDQLTTDSMDIVFVDVTFINTTTGLQILKQLNGKETFPLAIAVVPEDDDELTAQVLDLEPFFYISKPYNPTEVKIALRRASTKINHIRRKTKDIVLLKDFNGIIGTTPIMRKLFDLISRVADDDFSTVLIRGESGTGKELVAKAIHARSKRKSKNFVPVNCAAIPDDLLESELFGHTKGAFTGATQNKQGRIQYADGGTLFLDEIGDMKPTLQAKLLRVLQEKEFEPVGGLQSTPVDTRVLAATHCDLEQLVQEGKFREDLYYRLSVVPLQIPPLKERRKDIPLLLESFIENYTTKRDRDAFRFSAEALLLLVKYNWRGNVRELENLTQHMSILYSGKTVEVDDLPDKFLNVENQCVDDVSWLTEDQSIADDLTPPPNNVPKAEEFDFSEKEYDFKQLINDFETKLIISALRSTGGNKKEAARLLKLKRTTLLEKIKKKKLNDEY